MRPLLLALLALLIGVTPALAASRPNDPFYKYQWAFAPATNFGVDTLSAWDFARGESVVVAVVDSGFIGAKHYPDFGNRILPGYDFVSDESKSGDGDGRDADPTDPGARCGENGPVWHGTKVASIIGATANNKVGTAGVAPLAKLLFVRVGGCELSSTDIADGIRWAAGLPVPGVPDNPNPAKIINVSIGSLEPSSCWPSGQSAIDEVTQAGAIVVVAAGNGNTAADSYAFSNCSNVISVAATDSLGFRSAYSNYGPSVDIAAPTNGTSGCNDPAVVPYFKTEQGPVQASKDVFECEAGTSFAAPLVSGALALAASFDPSTSSADLLTLMASNVTGFGGASASDNPCLTLTECGVGILSAGKLLNAMSQRLIPSLTLTNSTTLEVGGTLEIGYSAAEPDGTPLGGSGVVLTSLTPEACSIEGWLLMSMTADDCRIRLRTGGTVRMAPKSFDFTIDQVGLSADAKVKFVSTMLAKRTQVLTTSSLGGTWSISSSSTSVCKVRKLGSLRYAVTSLKKGRCTLRAKLNAPGPYEDASLNVSIQVR
jgi:hypothetical protein